MSDLLSVGASGVRAYQTALTTVSENIANAGTAGYSRRTATLGEIGAASSRSAVAGQSGSGVVVTGIARAADDLRSASVRAAGSDLARTETSVNWLQQIETTLSGNTLSDSLTSFFNSAKAVAADPTASTPRSAFIEAGKTVANAFSVTGNGLTQATSDLDTTTANALTQINSLADTLGKVNDGLGRTPAGSSASAQLLDQRDQILEQLSAISNITVSTDDIGRATVRLGDASGPTLLSGDVAGLVSSSRNASGAVSFAVARNGTVATVTPTGGALAGIIDGAQRIANASAQLNQIASDFTSAVNSVQAQGRDLDGNPGAAFFTTGASPTDISVAITDPRTIAAAAVGGGTRDNSNLTALETVRSTGGYESNLTNLISTNAATLASRQSVATAQTTIHDGAVTARDSSSGVSLDTEAVDLMRFQQAYQASSKVIQTAQDMLQTILNLH
jgi:flagellar hook-associated protein 1 FlgK